jgi:outer membrane protein TolC
MKIKLTLIYFLFSFISCSQDTIQQLDLITFLQHVQENHPVALVASNDIEKSTNFIRMAKGAFDPILFGGIDQKYYDGTTYYSTMTSGIKIPTRIGWNLKIMGDLNRGQYLDGDQIIPNAGLTYLGVEIPIGRGMFTDDQRTQIKRALVSLDQSMNQRQLILNDLLYEAGQHFINWQEQQAQLELAKEVYTLAETRLSQVRISYELGDRAAIDTVEAFTQFYSRRIDLNQRDLNVKNARIQIENYLWEQGMIPLTLDDLVTASSLILVEPKISIKEFDSIRHPVLSLYDLKIVDLELERKLKIEQLKPQFNINYNLLQTPSDLVSLNYSFTNYKWGATFYMPILLRKERSSLAITKLKIENTQIEMSQKQRDLLTKQKQIQNEWITLVTQTRDSDDIAEGFKTLSTAETALFDQGESSLFLINARELGYISSKSKYIEFLSKTNKSALSAKYILGQLGN